MEVIVSILDKVFRKGKLSKLEKMKLDNLEDEKIDLESKQGAIVKKVDALEKRKNDILRRAKAMSSDLDKKSAYISYKQIDQDSKAYIAQHNMLSKNVQLLGSLIHIKRKEQLLKDANVWSTLSGVSAGELDSFLIEMKTKAAQQDAKAQKFVEILGDFDEESQVESEPGFSEFMNAIERIPATAADEELAKARKELDASMGKNPTTE
jgi:hypothetical protein